MAAEPRCKRCGDFGIPLRRVLLKSLGGGGFVGLAAGFVEAEFDDRDIGVAQREVVVEFGLRQIEFDLVERFERVAEVNRGSDRPCGRVRRRARSEWGLGFGAFEALERFDGVGDDPVAFAVRAGPPGLPIEAEELVEERGAFKSERDGREIGQGDLDNGITSNFRCIACTHRNKMRLHTCAFIFLVQMNVRKP